MTTDPLRALLRGCKRSKGINAKDAFPTAGGLFAPTTASVPLDDTVDQNEVRLAPELDFFGSRTTLSADAPRVVEKESKSKNKSTVHDGTTALSAPYETNNHLEESFLSLVSNERLRTALSKMGISAPTEVQQRTIPVIQSGHDAIAVAPTGSGKTLAYALPLLADILCELSSDENHVDGPRVLILAPTRELAQQISRVFTRLAREGRFRLRHILLASRAAACSLGSTPSTLHVVVATPQTAASAVTNDRITFKAVRHVVLDEADELLRDIFLAQVDSVLAAAGVCKENNVHGPRVHLFSATMPPSVQSLVRSLLSKPKRVFVAAGAYGGAAAVTNISSSIAQEFRFVGGRGEQGKIFAVRSMMKEGLKPPILVFVQSKERAAELFRELVFDGVHVDAIHGDRTAAARTSAITRFRAGKIWVLIATDLLSRGLDFLHVNTVINYDMPSSPTGYVHRIGRTGRNGRNGRAITLFTEEDKALVGAVVKVARASGADVPEWLIDLGNKVRKDELKRLERRPPKREQVGGPNRASLKTSRKRRKGNINGDTSANTGIVAKVDENNIDVVDKTEGDDFEGLQENSSSESPKKLSIRGGKKNKKRKSNT